jgi:Protein of unknown function (DUF3152)
VGLRARVLTALVLALPLLGVGPASAGDPVVNTAPPAVAGVAAYRERLTASPGAWAPEPVTLAYQWLRDGTPVDGATGTSYRLGLDDLGHTIAVIVVATDATGQQAAATSAPTAPVTKAALGVRRKPVAAGVPRYTRRLTVQKPRVAPRPDSVRYRWLRDDQPIPGARGRSYRLGVADVGHRVRVLATVRRAGYRTAALVSRPRRVLHLTRLRRRVTYHVETRGPTTANLAEFRRHAQQTFDHPRGWRSAGVGFARVARGGDFTLVLAVASAVPGFSSGCSAMWSCRVGRYVVVNQTRWMQASPAWNAAGRSRRDYRHLVVNHETGHWLGHGHRGCAGRGPAPVMMQQSKGTGGCSFNPWPLPSERWFRR